MASEQDKDRLRAQAAQWMRRIVERDEQQRRKQAGKARRARREREARPRGSWDEDDEPFERMRRSAAAPPRTARPATAGEASVRATIAAVHANRLELDDGRPARVAGELLLDPTFRLCVGDEVAIDETEGPPRIRALLPRRSWLGRPDPANPHRELLLAANVDLAVVVVAADREGVQRGPIDRLLLALANGRVAPAICANKIDLLPGGAGAAALTAAMQPYTAQAIPVFACSAANGDGIAALRAHLAGRTTVFVGHSGVGKSALANALDPAVVRRTGEVREHDGKGRHTTTSSQLRRLADGTRLIDTPGVREFGLQPLPIAQVREAFAEFAPFATACRYRDCTHLAEPDCAVRTAVAAGRLDAARHASYARIVASLAT